MSLYVNWSSSFFFFYKKKKSSPSASKIPSLYPSFLEILHDPAQYDFRPGENLQQPVHAHLPGETRHKDNLLFRHAVVHEHPHRHQRRPAARHLRIQEKHAVVRRDVRGKFLVMQFRFPGAVVGLDEHAAGFAVGDHASQAGFETASRA